MRARRHSGSRSHVPCLPRQSRARRVLVAGRVDDPSQLQARHRLHGIPEHQRADSAFRKHHPHHWQGYVVNRAEHLMLESDSSKPLHANMRAGRKCHKREYLTVRSSQHREQRRGLGSLGVGEVGEAAHEGQLHIVNAQIEAGQQDGSCHIAGRQHVRQVLVWRQPHTEHLQGERIYLDPADYSCAIPHHATSTGKEALRC